MTYAPYENRPLAYHGVEDIEGYRLKVYSLVHGDSFDRYRFDGGVAQAIAALPRPAIDGPRPGVGFVILHQGRTADYVVIAWWDNENELPVRVFVRDRDGWRMAAGRESFCVWDLEVMWQERQLYVRTVLGGSTDGVDLYARVPVPTSEPL